MAEIVNLRQAKKTRARAEKRAAGDENAARFGRTKADVALQRAQADKATATLDAHKRAPEQRHE